MGYFEVGIRIEYEVIALHFSLSNYIMVTYNKLATNQ